MIHCLLASDWRTPPPMRNNITRILAISWLAYCTVGLIAQQPTANDYINLGHAAESHLQLRRAIIWYRQAIQCDPTAASPWEGLARIGELQGRWEDAADAAEQAIHIAPNDTLAWHLAGEIAWARGNPEQAQQLWQQGLQHGYDAPLASDLAHALLDQGSFDAAHWSILFPSHANTDVRAIYGIVLLHYGAATQAAHIFATLPLTEPISKLYRQLAVYWATNVTDQASLGIIDIQAGHPRAGKIALTDAIQHANSPDPRWYSYLAWAEWQTSDLKAAQTAITYAAPDDPLTIGVKALLEDSPGTGLALIQQWSSTHPTPPALWAIAAQLAEQSHNTSAAFDTLWHLTDQQTIQDDNEALKALAQICLATSQGQIDNRCDWVFSSLEKNTHDDAVMLDLHGQWMLIQSDPQHALNDWHAAIRHDPALSQTYMHLGLLEYRMGDLTAAGLDMEKAVDLDNTGQVSSVIGPYLATLNPV
jgi:tetratricopeptide (TPR) repeat protein